MPALPLTNDTSGNHEIPGSSEETPSELRNSAYSFRNRKAVQYTTVQSDSDPAPDDSGSDDSYSDDSYSDEPSRKRLKFGTRSRSPRKNKTPTPVSGPSTIMKLFGENWRIMKSCSYIKLTPEHTIDCHNCDLDDPPQNESQPWVEFYKRVGRHIHFLDLEIWSWKPVSSKCPYNLLKILQMCPNLKELFLNGRVLPEALGKALLRKSLPNLTKLSIHHAGEIIYKHTLKSILKASSGLQSFDGCFHSLIEANDIIEMLRDVSCLKSLSLRSYAKDGYLARDQIVRLVQISTENLQDLQLGNGLWEDVDGESFENLLRRFSKLKKFKVNGSYQGKSLRKPEITIRLPTLVNLEFLDIGGNYKFASVDESPGGNNDPTLSRNANNKVITVEGDLTTEFFSVTIAFPLLPSLKTLILGNLYKIEALHFSSFPNLRIIRVGSPWHLTVKFPENTESRKFSYPLVTDLQLPDCLMDPFIVQNIPIRFPKLKKCWIFLPSVKVLRTFFKTMEKSGLKELYLKTQFDFEVTMELCLLGQPSKALKHYRDYMMYEELEKYEKFQEFVQFHNIEIPPKKIEDTQELEDDTCAGLTAMKNLKILQLEHIPRILLIPKGNLHWTHVNAEFTNHCIGFKRYPLSANCLRQLSGMNCCSFTWPNFTVCEDDVEELFEEEFEIFGREDLLEVVYDEPGTSKTIWSGVDRSEEKVAVRPAMLEATLPFREKKEQRNE